MALDPNEESRLRSIISARSTTVFESRIRELANDCDLSLTRRGSSYGFGALRESFQKHLKRSISVDADYARDLESGKDSNPLSLDDPKTSDGPEILEALSVATLKPVVGSRI